MSNTDPNKKYKRRASRTQPKTTKDEPHGPQQKTTKDEQHGPNQKLQWMSNMDPTKNYNG
jgi:hypothetical protein